MPNILAVGTAQNFGIAGTGKVIIFDKSKPNGQHIVSQIQSTSQVNDVKFSEANKNLVLFCNNTSLELAKVTGEPLLKQQMNAQKVACCNWNPVLRHLFVGGNDKGQLNL